MYTYHRVQCGRDSSSRLGFRVMASVAVLVYELRLFFQLSTTTQTISSVVVM